MKVKRFVICDIVSPCNKILNHKSHPCPEVVSTIEHFLEIAFAGGLFPKCVHVKLKHESLHQTGSTAPENQEEKLVGGFNQLSVKNICASQIGSFTQFLVLKKQNETTS